VEIAVIALAWGLILLVAYVYLRRRLTRSRSRQRVFEGTGTEERPRWVDVQEEQGWLTRWLFLAGFRAPGAAAAFVGLEVLALCLGLFAAYSLMATGMVEQSAKLLHEVPGAVNDLFSAFVHASPWIVVAVLVALPWLAVRDARQRRVLQVEQDLPVCLELLATLSEAGLGFDAALDRVLQAQPQERVLTAEFRTFQIEVLAGRPRVQCLRRLARRVEVTTLSIFISALVQTEQVGAAVADTLRSQAEDMRNRRRERAMTMAAALPVKLMFPLVVCFLPAILGLTLGPIFFQFFQMAENFFRTPGAR